MASTTLRVALVALLFGLPACFVSERFAAKVTFGKDGSYTFVYDGIITHVMIRAAAAHRKLSQKDEAEVKKAATDLSREPGMKSVSYLGRGQFKVYYEEPGQVNKPFDFLGFFSHRARERRCRSNSGEETL